MLDDVLLMYFQNYWYWLVFVVTEFANRPTRKNIGNTNTNTYLSNSIAMPIAYRYWARFFRSLTKSDQPG